jgi:hypothetical protein
VLNFKLSNKIKILLCSLAAAVVLFIAITRGLNQGQKTAQANSILKTAQNSTLALKYFYSDQNRYPTVLEFENQNIMLAYMSSFPLPNYPSPSCSQSFIYKRSDPSSYQLSFCLPQAVAGYKAGWNNINGSGGQ